MQQINYQQKNIPVQILAREQFRTDSDESLGSEQEAEAERELQRHTTMGTDNFLISCKISVLATRE